MVRTTTGQAEGPRPEDKPVAPKERMPRHDDLDDATWAQIKAMAASQQSTTADVIRRAIEAQYGSAGSAKEPRG